MVFPRLLLVVSNVGDLGLELQDCLGAREGLCVAVPQHFVEPGNDSNQSLAVLDHLG